MLSTMKNKENQMLAIVGREKLLRTFVSEHDLFKVALAKFLYVFLSHFALSSFLQSSLKMCETPFLSFP